MILIDTLAKNKVDSLLNLKIYKDNIEDAYEKYNNAIIDVFDHQLSIDDEGSSLIGSFLDHNLRYESRYEKIIKDFYRANGSKPVIIEAGLDNLDNFDILRILDALDYRDKLSFIDLIRSNKDNSHMFSIEEDDLLYLFVRLATRELLFPIFHFTGIGVTIAGSFDLSFPIFFSNKADLKEYSKLARKNKLFFRNIRFI